MCVIGYSLPADDLQARTLLSAGLAQRSKRLGEQGQDPGTYRLIDPTPAVAGRYFSVVGGNLDFRQKRFEHVTDDDLA